MSRFCKKCGMELKDGVAFCPQCGQAVQAAVQPNNPPPAMNNNMYQQPGNGSANTPGVPPQNMGNMNNPGVPSQNMGNMNRPGFPPQNMGNMNQPGYPPPNMGGMNGNGYPPRGNAAGGQSGGNGKYIFLAVIAFVVIALGAYFIMFNGGEKDVRETPSTQTETVNSTEKPSGGQSTTSTVKKESSHNSGVITGSEVRMRANPGTNSNIIGFFDKGEKVEILDVQPEWIQVKRTNGAVGWVSAKFCSY